jgi:DNA replication licensing factor MCM4
MRRLGSNKNVITATPRQLESLIRISEALAKMRLSNIVEKKDVSEALRLIKVATQQAAIDPITGQIDMDLISTGYTSGVRNKISVITEIVREILVKIIYFNAKIESSRGSIQKRCQSENLERRNQKEGRGNIFGK